MCGYYHHIEEQSPHIVTGEVLVEKTAYINIKLAAAAAKVRSSYTFFYLTSKHPSAPLELVYSIN